MKINIRQFRANLSKFLEESTLEITRDGEIIGVYTKLNKNSNSVYTKPVKNDNVCTQPIVVTTMASTIKTTKDIPKEITDKGFSLKYGCGCKKGDSILCPKHKRS